MMSDVPIWLNAAFVQKVLKNSEDDESIEVLALKTEPAVKKGENYGSIMIRITVEYSRNKSGPKTMEKKSLLLKTAPTVENSQKEMIEKINAFDTEIKMMTTTLKKMNEILKKENYSLSARVLYTEVRNPSLLVIEDLVPLGYRMADRHAGLDLDHCIIAMIGLAKFHASSIALNEKDSEAMLTYNKGLYKEDYPEHWKQFFIGGIKNVAMKVAKWSELDPSCHIYSEKLLKLAEVCYERAVSVSKPKDNEFNVLNHGDFWVNNMLFRYNKDGKVTDHIFVDFQLSFWSSPVIDILSFLNTSIADDVEINHRDALLEKYLDTLTFTMKSLGCKTKPPSMEQLEKSINDHALYGILSSCLFLPWVRADKNEPKSYDEIMESKSDNDNPIYALPAYRKLMIRRLTTWNARGFIDV